MNRPTVLHCVSEWGVPSQRFVRDLVGTTTATRAVVACQRTHAGAERGSVRVRQAPSLLGRVTGDTHRRAELAWLAAVAAAERTDLLHAHLGYWAGAVARVARQRRRPFVLSLHGHDLLVRAGSLADPTPWQRADLVIVPSSFLADAAVAFGLERDRVRVIPSGVDLARIPFETRQPDADGTVTVLFVGRFVDKKGAVDAAKAVADVGRDRPFLHARFVGYGPQAAEVASALAPLGDRAVVVDGAVSGTVDSALQAAHLLVSPSRTAPDGDAETLSVVNLEAQAAGLPVITTRHGGIPDSVTPKSAVLVEEGDQNALVNAIAALVDDPARWPAMGLAGRAHVALNFELGARTAEVEAHYAALVNRRPLPPIRAVRREWPTVAVVVPTYNRIDLVGQTIDALAAQTYPADRVEVSVVDDASTDDTVAALEERSASTPWPLRVLRHTENRSAAEARNTGLAATTSEVVAFTDSDCRPEATWLEALVAGLDEGVDMVQGRTAPDPAQPVRPLSRSQWVPSEYGLYETCNLAYRRDVLDRLGPGPFGSDMAREVLAIVGDRLGRLGFGEDTELAWRAKRAGAVSRFAAQAVVRHEVFAPDPNYLVRRATLAACFPLLVRRVPELRDAFLWRRWFVGRHRVLVLAAVAGAVLTPIDRRAALLAAPWFVDKVRPMRHGWKGRVRALPVVATCDLVETAALLAGSVRAREVVL